MNQVNSSQSKDISSITAVERNLSSKFFSSLSECFLFALLESSSVIYLLKVVNTLQADALFDIFILHEDAD